LDEEKSKYGGFAQDDGFVISVIAQFSDGW
jgi:hypothetical protein